MELTRILHSIAPIEATQLADGTQQDTAQHSRQLKPLNLLMELSRILHSIAANLSLSTCQWNIEGYCTA